MKRVCKFQYILDSWDREFEQLQNGTLEDNEYNRKKLEEKMVFYERQHMLGLCDCDGVNEV